VLCCHSNETCVLTAIPPNIAQVDGTQYHSPNLHPGPCSSMGMRRGTDRQTAMTTIHFVLATPHAKCNKSDQCCEINHTICLSSALSCISNTQAAC